MLDQRQKNNELYTRVIALWDRGWLPLVIAAFLELDPALVRAVIDDELRRSYAPLPCPDRR